MFFRGIFNFDGGEQGKSSIDKLLESDNCSLEALMEESEFVSEIRYNSQL
jgi:hypothetical protein